ncbi:hypothetical protein HHK36_027526 [Tetracentron sinense]|uniref:Uncharacterized protein n=1 Tax=Tetracentron sinense TaxID=13715 RepID=A0A834YHX0_TETSI|nr:hypothetical protein HHK36_027526 [Tetracentron sinense]
MGNCLETCMHDQPREKKQQQQQGGFIKEDGSGKSGFRVKIVLRKEELEWLMFQLKEKGGKRLEDVLGEMERGGRRVEVWKPSLESIMEKPEVHEMDR